MKKNWLWPVMACGLFISACGAETAEDPTDTATESTEGTETASAVDSAAMELEVPFDGAMDHVHGMGYIEENGGLYFASHHGLKVHRDGKWTEIEDQYHDFMGFNATATGFVSSGHPDMQSGMQNPLGIKRSDDGERPSTISDLKVKRIFMKWQSATIRIICSSSICKRIPKWKRASTAATMPESLGSKQQQKGLTEK